MLVALLQNQNSIQTKHTIKNKISIQHKIIKHVSKIRMVTVYISVFIKNACYIFRGQEKFLN